LWDSILTTSMNPFKVDNNYFLTSKTIQLTVLLFREVAGIPSAYLKVCLHWQSVDGENHRDHSETKFTTISMAKPHAT
jgi:hypothetical protein